MRADAIGYVTHVKCKSCGESFPVFTLSADTNMVTTGIVPLTSILTKEIALVAASSSESIEAVAVRVGRGYRYSSVSASTSKAAGLSFQEFLKLPQQSPVYSCIFCNGLGEVTGRESAQAFETHSQIVVHL